MSQKNRGGDKHHEDSTDLGEEQPYTGGSCGVFWHKLKCFVGVTDEKDIADLTDMEEREILDTKHLHNMGIVRKLKTDSNIAD